MNQIISITAFVVLTLLWLGFAAALLFNPEVLHKVWTSFRKYHVLIQLAVGLLFLPLVIGLWIWNTRWPGWLRLVLVIGLGWGTITTFFPRMPLA